MYRRSEELACAEFFGPWHQTAQEVEENDDSAVFPFAIYFTSLTETVIQHLTTFA